MWIGAAACISRIWCTIAGSCCWNSHSIYLYKPAHLYANVLPVAREWHWTQKKENPVIWANYALIPFKRRNNNVFPKGLNVRSVLFLFPIQGSADHTSLTNAFPLLLAKPVAIVAYAGVPHRQVDAVACPTDVWVHGALVDLFERNKAAWKKGTAGGISLSPGNSCVPEAAEWNPAGTCLEEHSGLWI